MKVNIYKSAAQVTIFSSVEKFLSFIYRIILSRSIGAEGLGIYQICLSVFSVFLTAASSGIPITVSRLMAKSNATGNARQKHAVVTSGVVCTLIFTVPVAVTLFFARDLYSFLFPDRSCVDIFLWLLPGLVLTSIYAVIRGSFWGNKQFLPYSVIELAENAVMVVCGCVLVCFASTPSGGARAAVIAVLVSYVFSFTVSVTWYIVKGGKFVNPKNQLKSVFTASAPITAMRTSTSLLNSCVAMFLPALLTRVCGYSDSQSLALYGTVLGMSVPILFIPSSVIGSIAVVVAPEMSENFYSGRKELLRRDVGRTLKASILVAAVLIPVVFTLGEDIGVLLYDNRLSGEVIKRFSFIMLPMCVSMITTTILNSMHREIKTLIYFFVGAAGMLCCIFGLTKILGINAYMVGMSVDFSITALLNLRLLKKLFGETDCPVYTLKSLIICICACIFGKLFSALFGSLNSAFLKILICGGAVSLFTVAAFYAMGMFNSKPFRRLIKKT